MASWLRLEVDVYANTGFLVQCTHIFGERAQLRAGCADAIVVQGVAPGDGQCRDRCVGRAFRNEFNKESGKCSGVVQSFWIREVRRVDRVLDHLGVEIAIRKSIDCDDVDSLLGKMFTQARGTRTFGKFLRRTGRKPQADTQDVASGIFAHAWREPIQILFGFGERCAGVDVRAVGQGQQGSTSLAGVRP